VQRKISAALMTMADRAEHEAIALPCRCGRIPGLYANGDDGFGASITLLLC